jgi:hypothetical protein
MPVRLRLPVSLLLCLLPVAVCAQTAATPPPAPSPGAGDEISRWGLDVSVTPRWTIPSFVINKLAGSGGGASISGSQWSVGFVRGRSTSGDWGVSFVHEPVKDGSSGYNGDTTCGFSNGPLPGGCFDTSGSAITQSVAISGVEIRKFIPFHLIDRRVQVGVEIAAGVGKLSGTLQKTNNNVTSVGFNSAVGLPIGSASTTVTTESVTAELPATVPLMHFGFVAAVLLHPAVKVRWEVGYLLPGASFARISATYLIGAH